MKQNVNQNVIQRTIIVILICLLLSHIMSVKVYNKREYYKNTSNELNNTKTECDCLDSINNKDKLYTPCAANIPLDNTIFNTVDNIIGKDKMKINGKYCFPIEKYAYDGIWNAEKDNIDGVPNKQSLRWSLPSEKQIEGVYCGDKFLILPEKSLKQGDVIIQDNEKFYESRCQVSERLQNKCNKNSIFSNIIKTTLNKYTINGL